MIIKLGAAPFLAVFCGFRRGGGKEQQPGSRLRHVPTSLDAARFPGPVPEGPSYGNKALELAERVPKPALQANAILASTPANSAPSEEAARSQLDENRHESSHRD
jgi:hypothetical protein